MKKIFGIYTLIGILCVPFIYFNNADGYRSGSSFYQWGRAIGGAFYWPSYIFSIEPEIDSESLESFQKSIIEIQNYRNDKLFAGKRASENEILIFRSIGNCLVSEGLEKGNLLSLYDEIFKNNIGDKSLDNIRQKLMEKLDGYDFSDIISEGEECGEKVNELLSAGILQSTKPISNVLQKDSNNRHTEMVMVPDIENNCDIDAKNTLKTFGLIGKQINVHGPDDEDSPTMGCPYRQYPKSGSIVKKGSVVTYRAWWEAG